MSVTSAPRARIDVKAAWPGVSMKVSFVSGPRCDLIGANVLRDATGLAANHVCVAQGVQNRGLAVVNVTHDGHDRRTGLQRFHSHPKVVRSHPRRLTRRHA